MENANKFLKDFASGISKGVNVAKLGKVVKFYPEVMKADVMPLPSEDNAMIINVPVATVRTSDFLLYYPLKPDDNVVLLFVDNDTDNILLGEDSIETERDHDVSDCICLGGITLLKEKLDVENKDALVIQNIENTARINITKDGEIDIRSKLFKVRANKVDIKEVWLCIKILFKW